MTPIIDDANDTESITSPLPPPPVEMISFFRGTTEDDPLKPICTDGPLLDDSYNQPLPSSSNDDLGASDPTTLCDDLFEMDSLEPRTIEEMVRDPAPMENDIKRFRTDLQYRFSTHTTSPPCAAVC